MMLRLNSKEQKLAFEKIRLDRALFSPLNAGPRIYAQYKRGNCKALRRLFVA